MPLTELKVDAVRDPILGHLECRLRVIVKTMDTRTGQPTAIVHTYPLPDLEMYGIAPEHAEGWMLDHLKRLFRDVAIHESDEWFKRDGVTLFDPHEGGRT
jgi:hypothetical protein